MIAFRQLVVVLGTVLIFLLFGLFVEGVGNAPMGIKAGNTIPADSDEVNVPLLIREALTDDPTRDGFQLLTGLARQQGPVTVGLPLPADSGITDVDQLGLSGASAGQFRVLNRWPNGAIQWLLVDTQADVAAGASNTAIALTTGAGNFGGADLAADQDASIRIDTGPAQFSIRKQGFNLLDEVVVDGVTVVAPGTSPGIVLRGTDGVDYLAANDGAVQVAIEENGPVRAVVVARGKHVSASGQRNLEFTMRMHFYRGQSRVKVFYTLRNASKEQVTNAPLQSLELVVRTTAAQPQVIIGLDAGTYNDTLASGDTLRLFQGWNDFPIESVGWVEPLLEPTGIEGYNLRKNGAVVRSGGLGQIIDLFYAQARNDSGHGVTVGTRFAVGWFPQGLGVDGDGTVRIGLFPQGNDKPYYVRFNSWSTHEALFDFTPTTEDPATSPRNLFFRFQYPLAARAQDSAWYNRTGAIWEKLASLADEYAYNVDQGWADPDEPTTYCNPGDPNACASYPRDVRPNFVIWRAWGWRAGGGDNQYDSVRRGFFDFLREGADYGFAYLVNAEQRARFVADRAILHADDYPIGAGDAAAGIEGFVGNNEAYRDAPNYDFVAIYGDSLDYEHPHISGVGLAYFLTGDERYREAYEQFGEILLTPNEFHHGDRPLAWLIFNLTDMYRFTGRAEFRERAWTFIREEMAERSAVAGQEYGMDWRRGFFVALHDQWGWDGTLYDTRTMASFIKGAMYPRALAYFLTYAAADNLTQDRTRDLLEGVSRYAAGELWYEYSTNLGDFGFPYEDSPDYTTIRDVRNDEDWYDGVRELFPTFLWGYLTSGDAELLRKGNLLLKGVAVGENMWNYNFPEKEWLTDLLANQNEYAVWQELAVQVTTNGNGSYTVSWTVPTGTTQYWIKYAEKPIVSWLNFDKYTQQYQYPPDQYTPFFAATNIDNEPVPAAPGAIQSMLVSGLDPAKDYHFAARYLAGGASLAATPTPTVTAPAASNTPTSTPTATPIPSGTPPAYDIYLPSALR